MDDLLRDFVTETNENLDVVDIELVRFEQDPNNSKIIDNVFRLVHTIKGTCGFIGLPRLEALAHAAETLMGKFRDGSMATKDAVSLILTVIDRIKKILDSLSREQREPEGDDRDLIDGLRRMAASLEGARYSEQQSINAPLVPRAGQQPWPEKDDRRGNLREKIGRDFSDLPIERSAPDLVDKAERGLGSQSIRVGLGTLDRLMTMVSELVLTRNQLLEIVRRHEESEFKAPLQRLSNVTAELQEGVMKTRMQPIGNAWQKLPRIVRDVANELNKKIDLEMQGSETELDRQVLDLIKDPLAHMVRNSADHGIEDARERRQVGKPERGRIRLSAYHEGGFIVIQIADDGRGLNTTRIKAKAVAQGLISESDVEMMSEAQIHKFIFAPGFSTADKISKVSGRGVGMDVVRNNIDQIGGAIDVKSVAGVGVSFTIRIPLTLAIVAALIVEVAGERFAIPQISVTELVRVRKGDENRVERIKDTTVLRLRNVLLPLVRLGVLLGIEGDEKSAEINSGYVVVTQVGSQTFGIVVDAVFHTEEIVVKPMSSRLRHISMLGGNTILGDGSVIMIIDPNGVGRALNSAATSRLIDADSKTSKNSEGDEQTTSLLVFRAGSARPKAVPLSLVNRLEEIDARTIEISNGRHMVQYRGHLMPLITMNESVHVRRDGSQPLLVFSDGARSMALVVDEIIDIVDDRLNVEIASHDSSLIGSAIIKGQATEIIDVGHFMPLAFEDWFRRKSAPVSAQKHSLLLVDDSLFFRDMLSPVLQAAGYDVTPVSSALEALNMIEAGRTFSVVITDTEMPDMDGFELTEKLRANPRVASLPIIALSSVVSPEAIEHGRRAGVDDYVAKFDRQGLIAAIKEQIDMTRAA